MTGKELDPWFECDRCKAAIVGNVNLASWHRTDGDGLADYCDACWPSACIEAATMTESPPIASNEVNRGTE